MSAFDLASMSSRRSGFLLSAWVPCTPPIPRMQGEKGRVIGGAESKARLPLKRRRQVYQQIILKRWCDQGDAHRNPRRSKSTWHRNGRQIEEIDEIRVQPQTGVQT